MYSLIHKIIFLKFVEMLKFIKMNAGMKKNKSFTITKKKQKLINK